MSVRTLSGEQWPTMNFDSPFLFYFLLCSLDGILSYQDSPKGLNIICIFQTSPEITASLDFQAELCVCFDHHEFAGCGVYRLESVAQRKLSCSNYQRSFIAYSPVIRHSTFRRLYGVEKSFNISDYLVFIICVI